MLTGGRGLQPGAVISDNVLVVELGVELHLPHHLLLRGLRAGQRDPLHGVVDVVNLVLGLEDHAEPSTTEALKQAANGLVHNTVSDPDPHVFHRLDPDPA